MQKDRNGVRVALDTDRLSFLAFRLISRSVLSEDLPSRYVPFIIPIHEAIFCEWFSTRGAYVPCVKYPGLNRSGWSRTKNQCTYLSNTPTHRLLLLIPSPNISQPHPSPQHKPRSIPDSTIDYLLRIQSKEVKMKWRTGCLSSRP